jgi:hypothetical protein
MVFQQRQTNLRRKPVTRNLHQKLLHTRTHSKKLAAHRPQRSRRQSRILFKTLNQDGWRLPLQSNIIVGRLIRDIWGTAYDTGRRAIWEGKNWLVEDKEGDLGVGLGESSKQIRNKKSPTKTTIHPSSPNRWQSPPHLHAQKPPRSPCLPTHQPTLPRSATNKEPKMP